MSPYALPHRLAAIFRRVRAKAKAVCFRRAARAKEK